MKTLTVLIAAAFFAGAAIAQIPENTDIYIYESTVLKANK